MPGVRLVVVDVDGTLLTPEKVLTEGAVRAVWELRKAGVELALTSGRPPRGLSMKWAWAYVTRRSRPEIITGGLPPEPTSRRSGGPLHAPGVQGPQELRT
jgi:hypothetical protein